jgi:hypothetical protein
MSQRQNPAASYTMGGASCRRNRVRVLKTPKQRSFPNAPAGGNGRALTSPKGPYLLGRMKLKAGLNRPVQSQAVNWATAGLLAGPTPLGSVQAGPRSQPPKAAAAASHTEAASQAQCAPVSAVDYVFIVMVDATSIMQVTVPAVQDASAHSLRTLPAASV